MRFPIAEEFHGPHRYWLRFSTEIRITPVEGKRFEPGDLLLLETDRTLWAAAPTVLRSRLCAVGLPRESGTELMLIRWGGDPEYRWDNLEADTAYLVSGGRIPDTHFVGQRPLVFDDEECVEPPASELRPFVGTSSIVALVILMTRPPENLLLII
jgi:hypothetical protein